MRLLNRGSTRAVVLALIVGGLAEVAIARDIRVRGSFEATYHPTAVDANGDGEVALFAVSQGRTNFGPVTSETWAEFLPWDGTFCGPTHVQRGYRFIETAFRFNDGSRLFALFSSGTTCADFVNFTFEAAGELQVIGGSGRFEGASGALSFRTSRGNAFPNGSGVFSTAFEGTITVP